MGIVNAGLALSLDGFIHDRNGSVELLYPKFEEFSTSDVLKQTIETTGAVAMGRHTYDMGQGDYTGYEFQVPLFILTHHVPDTVAEGGNENLSFNFVTDGIESLIHQAKNVAGDKDVMIVGGANIIQKCLKAGLIDQLQVGIMPVLLGDGLRLFEHLDNDPIQLEKVSTHDLPAGGTQITFKVLK